MKDFPQRKLTEEEKERHNKSTIYNMTAEDRKVDFFNNFRLNDLPIKTKADIIIMASLLVENTLVECENGLLIYSCDVDKAKMTYEEITK
jgi:hypothetical protein